MFKPSPSKQLTEHFYVFRTLFVNFYLYKTTKSYIIFDTGINNILSNRVLKKFNINPEEITHIFLTHSDYDHRGALSLYTNSQIYLYTKEEKMINKEQPRLFFRYNESISEYNLLDEYEKIIIGNVEITLIPCIGHTIGSCMYSINDDILIGGDCISIKVDRTISNFSFFQNMNHKENVENVKRLKDINFFDNYNIIVTGYYGIRQKKQLTSPTL